MKLMRMLIVLPALAMGQVPSTIGFVARLDDSGTPVNGVRQFTFKLFTAASGGTEVWSEQQMLTMTAGTVSAEVGSISALTPAILDGSKLYLEVSVGSTTLSPRTPVVSTPYSVRSQVANQVGTLREQDIQRRISTACPPNSAIRSVGADGVPVCQTVPTMAMDGGSSAITGVFSGPGLSGGGSTGDVTLGVNFSGTGTATTVARSDHTHNYLPVGSTLTCSGSQKVTGLNANGSVICGADQGLTGTVPVASGGTGATTAASARTNLGAAASGSNSDITALNGLTTPLSAPAGGTGIAAPATANRFLVSNGTGGWNARLLTTTDLQSAFLNELAIKNAYFNPGVQDEASIHITGEIRSDTGFRSAGTIRLGLESPSPPVVDGVPDHALGLIVRRLNASNTAGNQIARNDTIVVTNYGQGSWNVQKVAVGSGELRCVSNNPELSVQVSFVANDPIGRIVNLDLYNSRAEMLHCIIRSEGSGHHTDFTVVYTNPDNWIGTLISTYNQ